MKDANAICCVVVDSKNVACVVVCDEEYPQKVCFTIILEMFREFYKTYNLMEIDAQTSKNKYKYKKEDTNMKV